MTLNEIFKTYFKTKLILWGGIGITASVIRLFTKPDTSLLFLLGFIFFTIVAAFALGLIDYNFYEKQAPKIVLQLLDKTPLKEFLNLGFSKEENDKLVGKINSFQTSLAPLTTSNGENSLVILIPLKLKEGLEEYFTNFDNHFTFRLSDTVIFAETIIKNYDKTFDFEKLNKLLIDTTQSLKNKNIHPLEVYEDKQYSSQH